MLILKHLVNPVSTSSVAVPDLCSRAFLSTLDAGAFRDLLRVAGRGFRNVPAFIFRNLSQRAAGED